MNITGNMMSKNKKCGICEEFILFEDSTKCSFCEIKIHKRCFRIFFPQCIEGKQYICDGCLAINSTIDKKLTNISKSDIGQTKEEYRKVSCIFCRLHCAGKVCKKSDYWASLNWCHLKCAMFFQAVTCKHHFIQNINSIPIQNWKSNCQYCQKENKGCLVKCAKNQCKIYSHTTCLMEKSLYDLNWSSGKKEFSFVFLCENHSFLKKEFIVKCPYSKSKSGSSKY
jgi:hypothetical protein